MEMEEARFDKTVSIMVRAPETARHPLAQRDFRKLLDWLALKHVALTACSQTMAKEIFTFSLFSPRMTTAVSKY